MEAFEKSGIAQGETIFDQHVVYIDGEAVAAATVHLLLHRSGVEVLRAFGRGDEGTRRVAEAEQDGVGSTGERE